MRHLLFILILLFSHACFAHQDTALNIDEDGNITGLPVTFTPTKFDRNNLKLTIGNSYSEFFDLYWKILC